MSSPSDSLLLLALIFLLFTIKAESTIPLLSQSHFAAPTPLDYDPHCTEDIEETNLLRVPQHASLNPECSDCVRMRALRCPTVRDVSIHQCVDVPSRELWRGFAHLLMCEVLPDRINEVVAAVNKHFNINTTDMNLTAETHPLNGSTSLPSVEAYSELMNLSLGVKLFPFDRWQVALLLNPESMTNVEDGVLLTCGLLVMDANYDTSNGSIDQHELYLPLGIEGFDFIDPPGFPAVNCQLEVLPPGIQFSIGSQLRCSLNFSLELLPADPTSSTDPWRLEWCIHRCETQCRTYDFSSRQSASAGALELLQQQQECVINDSDILSICEVPSIFRLTHGTQKERVLDKHLPAHHITVLHLPPVWNIIEYSCCRVSGLQAEGSSARSIVLTWTAYEHLFTDCILEFRVEVWPARRASSILSSKSTRTLTSWRHGCNDTSPTQDVECFDMQFDSETSSSHLITGLEPYTNYTFAVKATVRGSPHWSPVSRASATTYESVALINPIVRAPLVEHLNRHGSEDGTPRLRQMRVFWENPSAWQLGGRLTWTSVEDPEGFSSFDVYAFGERTNITAPHNYVVRTLDQTSERTLALRSHTTVGTNSSRAPSLIKISPKLETLLIDDICWLTLRKEQHENSVLIDNVQFIKQRYDEQSALGVSSVLCARSHLSNTPCIIQQTDDPNKISARQKAHRTSQVTANLYSNAPHSGLQLLQISDEFIRVGLAVWNRAGHYSALSFEECDLSALGLTRSEFSDSGCGLAIHLSITASDDSLDVTWSADRCVLAGRRPREYVLLAQIAHANSDGSVTFPANLISPGEKLSANATSIESAAGAPAKDVHAIAEQSSELCGLPSFPRAALLARGLELDFHKRSVSEHDCAHDYSHKISLRHVQTDSVIIVTLGAHLQDGTWFAKSLRSRGAEASTSWLWLLLSFVVVLVFVVALVAGVLPFAIRITFRKLKTYFKQRNIPESVPMLNIPEAEVVKNAPCEPDRPLIDRPGGPPSKPGIPNPTNSPQSKAPEAEDDDKNPYNSIDQLENSKPKSADLNPTTNVDNPLSSSPNNMGTKGLEGSNDKLESAATYASGGFKVNIALHVDKSPSASQQERRNASPIGMDYMQRGENAASSLTGTHTLSGSLEFWPPN